MSLINMRDFTQNKGLSAILRHSKCPYTVCAFVQSNQGDGTREGGGRG